MNRSRIFRRLAYVPSRIERNEMITRRYLVASSLARLIRKERGGNRITEGHFPNQADRSSFVVLDGDHGSLVLVTSPHGYPVEERTDVPRTHAEALLDVTAGKVDFVRST